MYSNNLPPGVTQSMLDKLYADEPECCGEVMEYSHEGEHGPVFVCLHCGNTEGEPNEE